MTGSVQEGKPPICQCTLWICGYVPMLTQENVWSTSTHLQQALKLLKGLTVGKFVNIFDHRPKVSLVLYKQGRVAHKWFVLTECSGSHIFSTMPNKTWH
jgi:hypothetical protein